MNRRDQIRADVSDRAARAGRIGPAGVAIGFAGVAAVLAGCSLGGSVSKAPAREAPVAAERSEAPAVASAGAEGPAPEANPWEGWDASQTEGLTLRQALERLPAARPSAEAGVISASARSEGSSGQGRGEGEAGARRIDPAVSMYGETPAAGLAAAASGGPIVLDGMESLQQVTFATEGADFDPTVSRDGKFIVFASTQHRPTADIYLKSTTGRTVTQLTADPAHDVMPAISPDGRRIAFASNRSGSWDIYVMSAGGGQAVQITSGSANELHPSWSPDGKRLVFCRLGEMSGRWEMWVTEVDQPVLSEFIGYGLFPQWCPVAKTGAGGRDKILFQRSRERGDRAFSVWTIDYRPGDASSPTEIVSSRTSAVINPAWSPDGEWIAFATVPNPNQEAEGGVSPRPEFADLWMSSVDGTGRVNLTSGRFVNLMPAWASDGRIYFVSDRGGVDNIWSIGTERAMLAATGRAAPDSKELANVPSE